MFTFLLLLPVSSSTPCDFLHCKGEGGLVFGNWVNLYFVSNIASGMVSGDWTLKPNFRDLNCHGFVRENFLIMIITKQNALIRCLPLLDEHYNPIRMECQGECVALNATCRLNMSSQLRQKLFTFDTKRNCRTPPHFSNVNSTHYGWNVMLNALG